MTSPCSLDPQSVFPFTALVGQDPMKLALLLNAVNPLIGGVLIRGEKGTAKSTAARGLAVQLPDIETISGCAFHCDPHALERCPDCRARIDDSPSVARIRPPYVTLPLGATEDCVVGTIDFEAAIRWGEARFRPGLLARAHRGVLYVDEVNLLDDHLVDSLLDAAESGINRVEREGMSVWHPSRFLLIGTMNPEEGELRPQLLDRFGLAVEVKAEQDLEARIELMRRREQFDRGSVRFAAEHARATALLADQVRKAGELVKHSATSKPILDFIAAICTQNHVAGHRADIIIERAARAHAALAGRTQVTADDVLAVAPLALQHRMRTGQPQLPPPPPRGDEESQNREQEGDSTSQGPDEASQGSGEASQASADDSPPSKSEGEAKNAQSPAQSDGTEGTPSQKPQSDAVPDPRHPPAQPAAPEEKLYAVGQPFAVKPLVPRQDRRLRTGSGRRTRSRSATTQGRYVKSSPRRLHDDLALDATLRAAAPFQVHRRRSNDTKLAVLIREQDVRHRIRERRVGASLLFVVDGSGSMGAEQRMMETKAAVMSLLLDAYQKRDKVGLVVFRQQTAEVLLEFTNSIEQAARLLTDLPVGGRTPLTAGLARTAQVLRRLLRKEPTAQPLVLVLTDGKANVACGSQKPHHEALAVGQALAESYPQARFVVVDTEPRGAIRLELAKRLASAMGADYFRTEDLRASDLVQLARSHSL